MAPIKRTLQALITERMQPQKVMLLFGARRVGKTILMRQIVDSFTGKTRPCNSLSGGETFMASISLALAISDTIQSRKSGINIDSDRKSVV